MSRQTIERFVPIIEWDDIELSYIDYVGNLYKTIEDIPKSIRHLVKPMKPHKFPRRLRSCSS